MSDNENELQTETEQEHTKAIITINIVSYEMNRHAEPLGNYLR